MTSSLLVIDDDPSLGEFLEVALEPEGFEVSAFTDPRKALLELEHVDVVLIDLKLGLEDGTRVCQQILREQPGLPVIVMTAFGSLDAAVASIRAGAYDFLSKPFEVEALLIALHRAMRMRGLREEVNLLRQELTQVEGFEELVGESAPMRKLRGLLERIAHADAAVLIRGATGCGKELVARAIHRRGPRADQPFVAVNCAAIAESLLESELFGHTRGAFTGADTARQGLLQRASGGSLLLDEIGDMPLALQAKLLRVLEEKTVRPLGSDKEVPIDVRILAATHCDLEEAVRDGSFREDLLYRINVLQVPVPPLRERGTDVLLLAQRFVDVFATRNGKQVSGISRAVEEKLLDYDWPGNVRELRNCIERAVVMTRHEKLVVEDLPRKIQRFRSSEGLINAPDDPAELVALDQVERHYILRVLETVGWNKAHAARILGINRKTLYRKLEQFMGDSRRLPVMKPSGRLPAAGDPPASGRLPVARDPSQKR
ncbi:MAG: sigma-54-dependent Fis family transcriptional regulator [Planctomycetes bacterium]|nr:sigma-54-dependent Fis family transcriptional regulator [Planctomycetota bacterium]